MYLGIDFGTTKTVVSAIVQGELTIVSFETEEQWLDGVPTLAAVRETEWRFGLDVLDLFDDPSWHIITSFKRALSDPDLSFQTTVETPYGSVLLLDLLTRYLSTLHEDLRTRSDLPLDTEAQETFEVMIATPAHAHSTQRFLTMQAFQHAGFQVKGMQSEPTAAGIEYAHRFGRTFNSVRDLVLVYDLGGGTFDVSLIHKQDNNYEVLRTAGLSNIGGDDFDQLLMEMTLGTYGIETHEISHASRLRLLFHCREIKESLSANSRSTLVELGFNLTEEERARFSIEEEDAAEHAVQEYFDACEPLLNPTLELLDKVLEGLPRHATDEEHRDLDTDAVLARLAGVYVVGGASLLPTVGRALRKRFGRRYHRANEPSATTAVGLTIALEKAEEISVKERFSRNFGVFREAEDGAKAAFDLILPAQTFDPQQTPPALVRVYRPTHNIGHFRYIECDRVQNHDPTGDLSIVAEILFPFEPALRDENIDLQDVSVERFDGQGHLIEERYSINPSGAIELSIRDLEDGYCVQHRLQPHPSESSTPPTRLQKRQHQPNA